MIKPLIFSTHHKAYLSVTFLWYLKFCFEKNFAFCLILNWEQPKVSPSDKSFRLFFLSVTSKKHFACGVSVCSPDGRFLRLAQGRRFCLMRSELTWPEQAAGEDQGTGVISRLTLQTQGPGPSQMRATRPPCPAWVSGSGLWRDADENLNHKKGTGSLLPCGPCFVFPSCFVQDCKVSTRVMLFCVYKP